jgi:hypothetical protein
MVGMDEQLRPYSLPSRLHIFYEWPAYTQGGLTYLDEFVAEYPDTALVVIDSSALFRGPVPRGGGYDVDYAFSHALGDWANRHDKSLLVVTHTGKTGNGYNLDDEPLDAIQNTTGMTAAPDTVLVMARREGVMTLYRRGRDLDDATPIKLADDNATLLWTPDATLGDRTAAEACLEVLERAGAPMSPTQIAQYAGVKSGTVRQALFRMLNDEQPLIGFTKAGYYLTKYGPANKPDAPKLADAKEATGD